MIINILIDSQRYKCNVMMIADYLYKFMYYCLYVFNYSYTS